MPAGRFAPSPTGELHLGNLRTALVAWLFARSTGRRFLLRFEDLDPGARPQLAQAQARDLAALGLDWDEDPVSQSDRRELYQRALEELIDGGHTYPCYCSRREIREATRAPHGPRSGYPGTCRHLSRAEQERRALARPASLRLRADGAVRALVDEIHGAHRGPVDDLVLQRNDGTPAYHLTVVVDDGAQGIDQVVRGDDLLDSTPGQIHLLELLGHRAPEYAHVPLVLGPSGKRLAKRDGAVTLSQLTEPARVLGLLAHSLGLAPRAEPLEDPGCLLDRFDPSTVPREPWVVDPDTF